MRPADGGYAQGRHNEQQGQAHQPVYTWKGAIVAAEPQFALGEDFVMKGETTLLSMPEGRGFRVVNSVDC